MRTWKITISPKRKKDAVLCNYMADTTTDARCMYNAANFYIRNTMTGIKKSPELRTSNETEVLHYVFTGIQKANEEADARYVRQLGRCREAGGMSGAVKASRLYVKRFSYPTTDHWFLSYETLDAIFKYTDHPVYKRMNSQVNQNAIRKVVKTWKSYFALSKDYAVSPQKYKVRPHLPGYIKTQGTTAWFTSQTARLVVCNGMAYLNFVNCSKPMCIGKASLYSGMKYVKTEVKPQYGKYWILVTFDDGTRLPSVPEHPCRILGIDIGTGNFAAAAGNFGQTPFLVRGGAVKSMNQWFNKKRAQLLSDLARGSNSTCSKKTSRRLDAISQKRDDFLRDFFYKVSWHICRYAEENHVDVIVAGHNADQKQNINIGRGNNQNFVSIPFCRFEEILINTAAKCGIPVVIREESYTSQASLPDLDDIPVYRKDDPVKYAFSGRRVHRGLYRTGKGVIINADVNGAGNIIRKEYPHAYDGQDMSYLYTSTNTVSYTDLYPGAKSAVKASYNQKKHRAGTGSAVRHAYRKNTRLGYRMLWGKSKYVWEPDTKTA